MYRLINMPGLEFEIKVSEGERNFRGIRMERDFSFAKCSAYNDMQKKLKMSDNQQNPLVLNGSRFEYVHFGDMYMPFVEAGGVSFRGSDFNGVNFAYGDLEGSDFRGTIVSDGNLARTNLRRGDLSQSMLHNCVFRYSDLIGAILAEADVWKSNFHKANLTRAKMKGVRNLDKCWNLRHVEGLKEADVDNDLIESALESSGYEEDQRITYLDYLLRKNYEVFRDDELKRKTLSYVRDNESVLGMPLVFVKRLIKAARNVYDLEPKLLNGELGRMFQYTNESLGMTRKSDGKRGMKDMEGLRYGKGER